MRIVFAGTPGFSVPCLQALIASPDVDVVGVVSQPDRKSGRGMKLNPSAVKQAALDAGMDVITPERLRNHTEALAWLENKQPDILVVVAFGMILPKPWLDAAKIAPVNVHASLLPRWRGAAPIERALLAGDTTTGVCVMRMEESLDTGAVYARASLPISGKTTGSDLWFALAPLGAHLLVKTLPAIAAGLQPEPQLADGITYATKLNNDERVIDWSQSAGVIDRTVRCFSPRPGARTLAQGKWLKLIDGEVIVGKVEAGPGQVLAASGTLDIACGDRLAYRIHQLQPEGKKVMSAVDYLRGAAWHAGDSLPT